MPLQGSTRFFAIVGAISFALLVLALASHLKETVPGSVRRSVVCNAAAHDTPALRGQRAAAWMLGVRSGMNARGRAWLAQSERTGERQSPEARDVEEQVRATQASVERLVSGLSVPRPATFTPHRLIDATAEFGPFIENSPNETATALATKYDPKTCELYKLGAYWGFSLLVRAASPGVRNVFAVEIGHYATKLGVPKPLWQRMLDPAPAGATMREWQSEGEASTNAVAKYLLNAS